MLSLLRRLSVFDKTVTAALVMYALFEVYSRNFWLAYLVFMVAALDVVCNVQQLIMEDQTDKIARLQRSRDVYKDLTHLILNRKAQQEAQR